MEKIEEEKNMKAITHETYDKGAEGYNKKFEDIGARTFDVDKMLSYVDKENPFVLEIGCGSGREAEYIAQKTDHYLGIDISNGMLDIAREKLPEAHFEQADVNSYDFPEGTDIICAFASLLHVEKEELGVIFKRMNDSLNESGVIYLSLKRTKNYSSKIKEDEFGERQYFYYSKKDILELTENDFEEVSYEEQELVEPWFTLILKKK